MACLEEAFHPRQHHALAVAAEIARAQSGREHLAIHARQLALEPHLQIPRRHPRPLLLRLEQAHRHALENHVHRDQRLGLPVMIIKTSYNMNLYAYLIKYKYSFSGDFLGSIEDKHAFLLHTNKPNEINMITCNIIIA